MWPDLWTALLALLLAIVVYEIGWRGAHRMKRVSDEAGRQPTDARGAPALPPTIPAIPRPVAEVAEAPSPGPPVRRRRLTLRAAREGIVMATILGPCRALDLPTEDVFGEPRGTRG